MPEFGAGAGAGARAGYLGFVPLGAVALGLVACASSGPGPPVPAEPVPFSLPDIPARDGALRVDIVYPPAGGAIAVRDSNFVFGSVGSGRATLRINGETVAVAPNGAFLAFLPVPDDGVYRIDASRDDEVATLEHTVRLPAPLSVPDSGAHIVASSAYPTGALALPAGEAFEVGFRGTAGGLATLRLPDGRAAMLHEEPVATGPTTDAQNFRTDAAEQGRAASRVSRYRASVAARSLVSTDSGVAQPRLREGSATAGEAVLELVVGADTARLPLRLNLAAIEAGVPRVAVATPPADAPSDWTVRGRPSTAGPFHWFFPPGTRFAVDGEAGGFLRARLSRDLAAWIPKADVRLEAIGSPVPRAVVAGARFIASSDHVDLRLPLETRLPYAVDGDGRTLVLDVYGATSETNFFQYGSLDPLIQRAMWSQPQDGVYRVTVELSTPVWGYDVRYDASDALVLRIRRPPAIDPARPLAALLIAVDAGHPPAGSTGPTRLTEAEANLALARRLQPLLEAAGARVLMTRTGPGPVDLGLRPRMAADSGAHVLVSLHNNAFPDGVNPNENAGTSVYYYQPHSLDLARHVQRELLAALGTRDIGIGRADLALARPTWMPSILSETLFMMLPRHEAALRDPIVQERIAQAHLRALEAFLRERAAAMRMPATGPGTARSPEREARE